MDFLLAIAVVVAGVWLIGFALSGYILAGCALFLVTTCCFGFDFLHFNVGTEATIDRLWMLVLVGLAILQRFLGLADPKPWSKVEWAFAAFLALLGIHCLWYWNTPRLYATSPPYWHFVIGYLYPAFLYFIARQAVLTERRVMAIHGFLLGFGTYLGFTGVMEMTGQWWAVFPGYIADETIGLHYGRARGPMVQSVSYGFYLSVCLGAACVAFFRYGIKGKLLALPIALLILVAAFLTHTRSVWMGTALVLLLVAGTMLQGRLRRFILAGAVVGGLLVVGLKFDSLVGFQREGSVEDTKSSAECRGAFAVVSWYMFCDKPFFGFGLGNFVGDKLPYLDQLRDYDLVMDHIRPLIHHNTYLDLLTELGLVGCLLYLGVLYGWGRDAVRLMDRARYPDWARDQGIVALGGLGSYMIQMLFHEVTYTSIDNALLYFLAGISAGLIAKTPAEARFDLGRRTEARVLREWIGAERHPEMNAAELRVERRQNT